MRFRGLVYRAHHPQRSWTPFSGEGARRFGGRSSRRGTPALYTSLNPMTANREAEPLGQPMQPCTTCAYEVDAEPIFDALDGERCRAAGVDDIDLACPSWEAEMLAGFVPDTLALADRLVAAGYVGMRVRSVAARAQVDDLDLVI